MTGSSLRGAVGLYIKWPGRLVEATDACSSFIEQLTSLVEAMKTAPPDKELGKEGA